MIKPIVDIDINNIFYQLHLVAKEECKDPQIPVYNTGIDEANKTFIGAGEFYIIAYSSDPDSLSAPGIDKTKALDEIKKYVGEFSGRDVASSIVDKDLIPIQHGQRIKAQRSSSDDSDSSEVNETISYDYSLLARLFGDSGDEVMQEASSGSSSGSGSGSGSSSSSSSSGSRSGSSGSGSSGSGSSSVSSDIIVGYMLPYLVNIAGQKVQPAKNSLERFMDHVKDLGVSAFFDGIPFLVSKIASAIGGLKIGTDSMSVSTTGINKVISKGIEKGVKGIEKGVKGIENAINRRKLDVDQAVSAIRSQFDDDYKNNSARISIDSRSNLETRLRQQKKFNNKIAGKLRTGSDMVITIIVKSTDTNYPKYNKSNLAETITKAFQSIDKKNGLGISGKFSKENLIKIGGYSTRTVRVQTKNTLTFESAKQIEDHIIQLLFEAAKPSNPSLKIDNSDITDLYVFFHKNLKKEEQKKSSSKSK